MSGVEVAGFVLAAIPLVISGLEHYAEGARTIKSMWNYPHEFAVLSRRLRIENGIFLNAIELLLTDCVDNETVTHLLDAAGGDAWSHPDVDEQVRRKLRRSYEVFLETVRSMNRSLEDFRKRLRLDSQGKGPFHDPRSFRDAYERFKFGLKKSAYMDLVNEISRDNASLTKLTEQSSALEPIRSKRRKTTPDFDRLRLQATRVFGTLHRGLRGSCSTPHKAHLYLDDVNGEQTGGNNDPDSAKFRVILHHEGMRDASSRTSQPAWLMEETEIRELVELRASPGQPTLPGQMGQLQLSHKRVVRFEASGRHQQTSVSIVSRHDVSPQNVKVPHRPATLEEIHDLCASIQQLRAHQKCGMCLGYILDGSAGRHELYWPEVPLIDKSSYSTVSLDTLLSRRGTQTGRLTVAHSRKMALALASSMLRLYDTPWLAKQWGRREVTLFMGNQKVMGDYPFISTQLHITSVSDSNGAYFGSSGMIRNETVFALGILLMELCLERPFDELMLPSDLNLDGSKHPASDFLAANRLLDEVYDRAGKRYGDAVRRCVLCEFDQRKTTLDDAAFRRAVYEGVVAVLEEDVRQFFDLK